MPSIAPPVGGDFVHLHNHTEYSMLDGAAKIDDLFAEASRMGMPALWSQDTQGMHNLFRMGSLASLEGYYFKPRMDRDLLARYHHGLIATTGCPSSEVQTRLRLGQYKEAVEAAAEFRDIFGAENYYCELMDHGLEIERRVQKDLLALARELGLPLVASNDLHYTRAEDAHSRPTSWWWPTSSTGRRPTASGSARAAVRRRRRQVRGGHGQGPGGSQAAVGGARADKAQGAFGFPGLETTLPLLLAAERDGRLSRADIVAKCATGPRAILGLPEQPDTVVEVDPVEFEITDTALLTRAAWTPFAGRTGFGRVRQVTLRGDVVFEDGRVIAAPGTGRVLSPGRPTG